MRLVRTALILAVAGALAVSAAHRQRSDALAPGIYLDHALALMQSEAITAPALDWGTVSGRAHRMAASATTAADTYPAIDYAVERLQQAGDRHAAFLRPAAAAAETAGAPPSTPPTVGLVLGRLGKVTLPTLRLEPQAPAARRYVEKVLSGISSIEAARHPCGWIVDLRGDTGGNAYSMLLSVAPIIGERRLVGLTGRAGFLYWLTYEAGAVSGGGTTVSAPIAARLPSFPPVAVLTSQGTVSAGEWVAVAFRGRPLTRSFGAATGGYTTGPRLFQLADGAALVLGVSYIVDRTGRVYRHAILPDVTVYRDEAAASRWLLASHACRAG